MAAEQPVILHVTYDELTALADDLDEKKNRKTAKNTTKRESGTDRQGKKGANFSTDENTEWRQQTQCSSAKERVSSEKKKQTRDRKNRKNTHDKKERGSGARKSSKRDQESSSIHSQTVATSGFDVEERAHKEQSARVEILSDSDGSVNESREKSIPSLQSSCRGVIKIPQGFDLKNSVHVLAQSDLATETGLGCSTPEHVDKPMPDNYGTSDCGKLYDPEGHERKLTSRAGRRWSENEVGCQDTSCSQEQRGPMESNASEHQVLGDSTTESRLHRESGVPHAKKTERKLNKEKTKQLMSQAAQAQTSLSNALSRGVLDKREVQKVRHLSRDIANCYRLILMLDVGFAVQHDVDHLLWRNSFYQVIETLRKYGKLFWGYSEKKELLSQAEINKELLEFLEESRGFYRNLLDSLQSKYEFQIQDLLDQPRKTEGLEKNAKLAILSCHHCLIFLGDIERYKDDFNSAKNWGVVRTWYLNACKLVPKNGKPYNQLAVVAVYANRKLDAVYYYIRSLTVSNPILTAREKLTTIFHEIQKKAFQLQRKEDEERDLKRKMLEAREKEKGRQKEDNGPLKKDPSQSKDEVWLFMRQGTVRRLVLLEGGLVQEIDQVGDQVVERNEEPSNPMENTSKVSLHEVNKKFLLHFLCAHGMLYTRISMERLPGLHSQLMGEFQTLLSFPLCATYVSCTSLLELMTINMFAICHTGTTDSADGYIREGTPQDQALHLAVDMLVSLLHTCTTLVQKLSNITESRVAPEQARISTQCQLSAPLRQFLPSVKVWADWLICHVLLWQRSRVSTHHSLWASIAEFINALFQIELPNLPESSDDDELVTLTEDEFLAGFKLLGDANRPSCRVSDSTHKDLAKDHLHMQAIRDLAVFLSALQNPPLRFDDDDGKFYTVVQSTTISTAAESKTVAVDLDIIQEEDHQDADSDCVIVESDDEAEEQDAGDEITSDVMRLRAVITEQALKPKLMFENYPSHLVPDTNCFIDHLRGLDLMAASGVFTLVVPLVVINELDGLRKGSHTNKYKDPKQVQLVMENARLAIDFLEDQFSARNPQLKALTSKGSVLDTIAFRSEDPSGRRGNNDDVILSCCLHYCEENLVNRLTAGDQPITIVRNVVLLSDDRNLRLKAHTRNVPVLTVPQFLTMAQL